MAPRTKARAATAMLVYLVTNAALVAAGLVIALMAARAGAAVWISVAAAAGLMIALPFAWRAAPDPRSRRQPRLDYQPIMLRTQTRYRRR